jgi:hypothetical protein
MRSIEPSLFCSNELEVMMKIKQGFPARLRRLRPEAKKEPGARKTEIASGARKAFPLTPRRGLQYDRKRILNKW